MACKHNEPCSCPVRQVLARVDSADMSVGVYTSPSLAAHQRHNRWRVFVSLTGAPAPTAGDVTVLNQLEDPETRGSYLLSKLGVILFSADGGSVGGELAPVVRQLKIRINGYVGGAGQRFVVVLETWREDLS